jgi:hypothetical protein
VELDRLIENHNKKSLSPPAKIAAVPNNIAKGTINSLEVLISKKLIKGDKYEESNILSGSDIAPIKGIKELRLNTSANDVSKVKINKKKNCFFLK